MRKFIYLITLLILTGLLSACASENIPLTEEESDSIAQYCAHLLLKYDKNKVEKRKLLDIDELEDIYKEAHKDDATPTPKPTKGAQKDSSGKSQGDDKSGKSDSKSDSKNTPTPKQDSDKITIDDGKPKAKSLTSIYGKDNFTVEYKSNILAKTYSENAYSTITAKDGELAFAVEFTIKNIGESKAKFVSNEKKVDYILYCENGDTYAPEISMLSNDILFLNDEIAANKEYTAVLLFFINENRTPSVLRTIDGDTGKVFDINF